MNGRLQPVQGQGKPIVSDMSVTELGYFQTDESTLLNKWLKSQYLRETQLNNENVDVRIWHRSEVEIIDFWQMFIL